MKRILTLCVLIIIPLCLAAADPDVLQTADQLYNVRQNEQAIALLEDALVSASTQGEQFEIYWRLARHTLDLGDVLYGEGAEKDKLRSVYERGRGYAEKAIRLAPDMYQGYYWKAASIGRAAQVKGVINALFEAKSMRDLLFTVLRMYPDHGESWYVLGMMYALLPGFPLSFGNNAYAVSLGRRSITANRTELAAGAVELVRYSYYLELAKHLWARDWSEAKRNREHTKQAEKYESTTDEIERNFYYEGSVAIDNISDRVEAKRILRWIIDSIKLIPDPALIYLSDLERAEELIDSWE